MKAADPLINVNCSMWRLDVEPEVGPVMVGVSASVCLKSSCLVGDDVTREGGQSGWRVAGLWGQGVVFGSERAVVSGGLGQSWCGFQLVMA